MSGWSPGEEVTGPVKAARRLAVVPYDAAGLGDRSYMVHDGAKAVVIDPQRDPAPYLATADELGVDVTWVLETHIHNDYVSGGLALARRTKASYGIPAGEPVDFAAESQALAEGDVLNAGSLTIKVLSTPGHTPHHLAFVADDGLGATAVMTGGSLLGGATGRTDLSGDERTAELTEAQWRSVRRLLDELKPSTVVLPTHGFGSFCSAGAQPASKTAELTIGDERHRNPVAKLGLSAFVETLVHLVMPIPAYYPYMAPLNRAGATEPKGGLPPKLPADEVTDLARSGTAVVDLRPRRDFARDHRLAALNIELGADLATYLGWLVPFTAPFVLLSHSDDDVIEACHLLSRIGRDTPLGWAPAGSLAPPHDKEHDHYEARNFDDLARRTHEGPQPSVLDVRFAYEWQNGHVAGARNVPLPDVADAYETLSENEEIWVHCQSGFRAAIASSVLSSAGLFPVLVDDLFEHAQASGLVIVGD
jgi:hydroxyacylglutathione hydrolase